MKKLAIVLAIILLIGVPLQIYAATWASCTIPTLTFNGSTANCSATVIGENTSDHIEVTMKLTYASVSLFSWKGEGYGYLTMNQTAAITPGRTYKLVVEVTINGVKQAPVYATGNS